MPSSTVQILRMFLRTSTCGRPLVLLSVATYSSAVCVSPC